METFSTNDRLSPIAKNRLCVVDWAKTYVLDSAFGPFVNKNTNILPNWFTQAIQSYNPMLEITGVDNLRKNLSHAKVMQRERLDKKEGHIHA